MAGQPPCDQRLRYVTEAMSQSPEILRDDAKGAARAAALLQAGALVGLPTETVYGLAADARNDTAVARVFEAKGRPSFNPLIVHVPDLDMAGQIAVLGSEAIALARAFWPGPLTLVLSLRPGHGLSALVTAGLPTVALRIPAHPAMQAVLAAFGGPIAAPSANPSGRISPTEADHVVAGLGKQVAAVLDAGPCGVGVESTILDPGPPPRLLREGGIAREVLEAMMCPLADDTTPERIRAPGQLASHYAPSVTLRYGGAVPEGAVTIGFGPGDADFNLSGAGDLTEAAATLFRHLHAADALAKARGAPVIHVAEVPEVGLGRAINDRLRRASA